MPPWGLESIANVHASCLSSPTLYPERQQLWTGRITPVSLRRRAGWLPLVPRRARNGTYTQWVRGLLCGWVGSEVLGEEKGNGAKVLCSVYK